MAWAKNGTPHTLTGVAADVEITDLTATKFNQILAHILPSTNAAQDFTFNSDSGSLYASRDSTNGGSDTTGTSEAFIEMRFNSSEEYFHVINTSWISGEEKLAISHMISGGTAGAGNAPQRGEYVFKYVPASLTDTITAVKFNKNTFTNYATGSNLSVLGSDLTPAGTVATKVQDGAIFYETDTNKSYVLNDSTWTEL